MIKTQLVVHIEFKHPAGVVHDAIDDALNEAIYPLPYTVDVFTRFPQKDHHVEVQVQDLADARKVDLALKQVLMHRGCQILGEGDWFTYYLTRDAHGFVELRQTRYRQLRETQAYEHPGDVCLVASDKQMMRQMTTGWEAAIDWASIPEDE
jgi:hypothetical protein